MSELGKPIRHLEVVPEKAPVISDPTTPEEIEREEREERERKREQRREREKEKVPAKV